MRLRSDSVNAAESGGVVRTVTAAAAAGSPFSSPSVVIIAIAASPAWFRARGVRSPQR